MSRDAHQRGLASTLVAGSWLPGLLVAAQLGCSAPSSGYRLMPGARAPGPAVGLRHGIDLARGRLTYAVAWADMDALAAVELGVRFALAIRTVAATGSEKPKEMTRIDLGTADFDIEDVAVAQTHGHVFVAGRDGRVRGFDARTGDAIVTWQLGTPATAVATAPNGEYVAMGTEDGLLCLRRYRDGALLQCALAHKGQISDIEFSPDSGYLASAAWTGEVTRWKVPSLAVVDRRELPGAACDLALSPDGRRLAIAHSAFPPRRNPTPAAGGDQAAGPRALAAVAQPGHTVALWHLEDGRVEHRRGHRGPVTSVAWTPDGSRLVSGSWDRTVRLWASADDPGEIARYGGFSFLIRDLAVSADGRYVAVGAWTNGRDGAATTVLHLLYRRGPIPVHNETRMGP